MLGLLYEGRHLSLSVRRKIAVIIFLFNVYKRLLLFLSRFFYIFNVLLFLEERFSSMTQPQPKKYDGHMQVKLSER